MLQQLPESDGTSQFHLGVSHLEWTSTVHRRELHNLRRHLLCQLKSVTRYTVLASLACADSPDAGRVLGSVCNSAMVLR